MKPATPQQLQNKRHCFTLVEMVAAMAIMVFVALIIGTASAAFYNAWRRSTRLADKLSTYQNIDRIMDTCVRNMIAFPWNDDNEEMKIVFEGKTDSMFFSCRRRAVAGENSAFLFIKLKLHDDKLIAEYHTLPRFPWSEEGKYEVRKEILAENIQSVSFLYANIEDEELVWNDTWEDYDVTETQEDGADVLMIPLAVQMTVEWKNGDKEVWLRRTAGVSKRSRLGSGRGYRNTSTGLDGGRRAQ